MEPFERELPAGQLVGLREQLLEALRESFDPLSHGGKELLLFRERAHARLRAADRAVQDAQPLVDRLDLLLVDGERPDLRVHRLE